MPGHIKPYKNLKDHWLLVVEAGKDPGTGKRQRARRVFVGGIRAAKAELERLSQEAEKGTLLDKNTITFGEYLKRWINDYGSIRLAPTTLRRYKQIITGRVIPKLGAVALKDLNPLHLQKFYKEIIEEGQLVNPKKIKKQTEDTKPEKPEKKELSHASIIYHHRVIHKALDTALKQQLILVNPANAVELPKPPAVIDDSDVDESIKVLSEEEVDKMLEAAKNPPQLVKKKNPSKRIKAQSFHALLFVAVRTGLRRGELLALRWSDISFKDKTLSVNRSLAYTPDKGIFPKIPKTKGSKRKISISDEIIKVLKQHKKEQAAAKLFWGEAYNKKEDIVFCQDDGNYMHPDTPSKWFPGFLDAIGLPKLNFHCLRHTHASLLLKAGADIKIISKRLGHSSIRITYDIYSHLMPGMEMDAVQKLEDLLKSN